MSQFYPITHYSVPTGHDQMLSENTCAGLMRLATLGAVVGGSVAAATNIRRVQRDEIDTDQAFLDTGRTAVASAAATALAGAAATAITNEGLPRLGILFAVGTAAMYGIQRWSDQD